MYTALCTAAAASAATSAAQSPAQSQPALIAAATQFLRAQLDAQFAAALTDKPPRIAVSLPKRTATLPACAALSAHLTGANTLRPRVSVALRCTAPAAWTLYAQATLSVPGRYYVAAHTIAPGEILSAADLAPRDGDLLALPHSAVIDPAAVTGWRSGQRIASGQIIRTDALRPIAAIARDQTVTLYARGAGFAVHHTGQALAAGTPGQRIPVRTASGQIVTAVVRDGGSAEVGW